MRTRAPLTLALALSLLWSASMLAAQASDLPFPSFAPRSAELAGTTWYVRTDGGSADQCTGLVDSPYPGSGTDQLCAWDHPFRALPPGGPSRIAGGDTLIIGTGSYMMGYGAPGADSCEASWAWDCYMSAIPSGPDPANRTRVLGAGWDTGSPIPPELWGTERAQFILNLTDAGNVEVGWLEVTDHSGCVEFHSGGLACDRDSPPFGDWAATGLYAEDSANVHLHDLNIHGLADQGVLAGRLSDWTIEDVRLAGNGWAGWNGDLDGGDSNSGTLLFQHWTVEWNGCGETWPGGQPAGCWAQTAGGYGDGVGTGATQGQWVIEDSAFLHNTSDGLDLLYAQAGASIEIRRTIAEGNAGNQIKTAGPAAIENSIIVGNCGYFDGQPFTFNVDNCRALGNALSVDLMAGDEVTVVNSTLTSEGDCLVVADARGNPVGTESIRLRNNIFQGQTDFLQPTQDTCLVYEETFPGDPFDVDYSLIADVKDDSCPGPNDICGVPPGLASTAIDAFDAHLLSGSAAIDAGTTSDAPGDDFDGQPRDAVPDIGAYEWGAAVPTPTVTPTPGACIDREGDTQCDDPVNDPDDDGCSDAEEAALGDNFDAAAWYDVYDVPVPAKADADGANGARNQVVDVGDILAVIFYAFTEDGAGPNVSGVDYDSIKGWDGDGDSVNDANPIHDIEEGLKYDRSPGLGPSTDTGVDPAGPPDGVIDIRDVLATIAQTFLVDCSAP